MPPIFSTRKSIKWACDSDATEPTSTWVFTASNDDFVDTRINKETGTPEWLINGKEKVLPTTPGFDCSVEFVHELDSMGDNSGSDVGHFRDLPNGDRLECGEMCNPKSGKIIGYEEVWLTLDPISSTPNKLINVSSASDGCKSTVWELPEGKGRFITIGKFSQGVSFFNECYQCVRLYEGDIVYKYGDDAEQLFAEFINGSEKKASDFDWRRKFTD